MTKSNNGSLVGGIVGGVFPTMIAFTVLLSDNNTGTRARQLLPALMIITVSMSLLLYFIATTYQTKAQKSDDDDDRDTYFNTSYGLNIAAACTVGANILLAITYIVKTHMNNRVGPFKSGVYTT